MMKMNKSLCFLVLLMMILILPACSKDTSQGETSKAPSDVGQIYLYGEMHGAPKILDKELELWCDYHQKYGMNHLFLEVPYYTAEYLNLWIQADDDAILDEIFGDLIGTALHTPESKSFFKQIKDQCPETIFHGTDIGHQYDTTGRRYLEYLSDNKLESTEQYRLALEAIEQGKIYYSGNNEVYRENTMSENFIREFNKLKGESVMGIYGAAHTGLNALDNTQMVPCMANQLKNYYTTIVHSEDLSTLAFENEPLRIDTIVVSGKTYHASYFDKQDISGFTDYVYREFWRLEGAYIDFEDCPKTGDILPESNFPMKIEKGQTFVIDYARNDGSVKRTYYRSDGILWRGELATEEFTVK